MSFTPGDFSVRPLTTSGIDAESHPTPHPRYARMAGGQLTQQPGLRHRLSGEEGSTRGLMLCWFVVNFLILSEPEGPHLHFILGPQIT